MSSPRVAVVGGGLAGIAAALRCADAGARVVLLEVRPRLGGAACSLERDGLRIDNGQHVFLRCCTAYRALLERLGTTGRTVLQPRLEIPVLAPGRPAAVLRRSALPAPLHLAGALLRYGHLGRRERLGVARAARALARLDPEDPALDGCTFAAWLADQGQGPRAVAAVWDLVARPALNLSAHEASLALAVRVLRTGLLDAAAAGDVGWARTPLGDVHAEPAAAALRAAGAEVRLGWRAASVQRGGDGALVVAGPDGEEAAEAVVLAVPPERALRLLPAGALAAPERLRRLGASPIVNVHVAFDRRVTDLPLAAGLDTPVQWLFDRTESAGLRSGQLLAISLSAAEREVRMSADALRRELLPALRALLPGARGARVERFLVHREHAATFRAAPGVRALRPGPATAVPGLALAGAWTDTGWPATMEGAVRSGWRAAEHALATASGAGAPGRALEVAA